MPAQTTTTIETATQPTSISTVSGSGTYGGTATVSATLVASGSGLANEPIVFTLHDRHDSHDTRYGHHQRQRRLATLTGVSIAGIEAGTYSDDIGASFAGDSTDEASSGSGNLSVAQAALNDHRQPGQQEIRQCRPGLQRLLRWIRSR